jgi:ferric-dicitrate binding protein FerR (iron transport regulator)
VHLEGEGYFKIAKDTEKPFRVNTSHLNIIALGTEFNVKAYPEDLTIETTLVEGSVKVEEIAQQNTDEVLVLKPNQKLTFLKIDSTMVNEPERTEVIAETQVQEPEQELITPVTILSENINIEPVISWKENRWIFEKQSLSQIAIDLERKFDVQIVFESEKLKSIRFTGIILAEPIEQVLEVMSISAPINFKVKGRVITLSENKICTNLNKNLYNQ